MQHIILLTNALTPIPIIVAVAKATVHTRKIAKDSIVSPEFDILIAYVKHNDSVFKMSNTLDVEKNIRLLKQLKDWIKCSKSPMHQKYKKVSIRGF